MAVYSTALRQEFSAATSKWLATVGGFVTLGGYATGAYWWWIGAATWQVVVVSALSTAVVVLVLYSAGRAAWSAQHKARIDAETELEILRQSHARDVEWERAIETFQGLWECEIDAILTKSTCDGVTTESWAFHVFKSKSQGEHDAHLRACETACRVAGHALGLSKTWPTLPHEIGRHTDPLERWLRFVAFKDGFDGTTGSGYDNTGARRVDNTSESINDVHKKSKRLCEDCRNGESFL